MDSATARHILVHGSNGPTPCGLTIRIVAGLLDFGVLVVVLFWLAVFTRVPTADGGFDLPVWSYVFFLIWWLSYYAGFEYFWNGQTPASAWRAFAQ